MRAGLWIIFIHPQDILNFHTKDYIPAVSCLIIQIKPFRELIKTDYLGILILFFFFSYKLKDGGHCRDKKWALESKAGVLTFLHYIALWGKDNSFGLSQPPVNKVKYLQLKCNQKMLSFSYFRRYIYCANPAATFSWNWTEYLLVCFFFIISKTF